ncbi:hypothetical protein LC609_35155 [Nostoc sp. XA013]|nr:hypothetical protein [Nostoc sp. XA013]
MVYFTLIQARQYLDAFALDELHERLQKLIGYIQAGDDIFTAANKASVSQDLVNKLIALNNNSVEEFRSQKSGARIKNVGDLNSIIYPLFSR